MDLKEKANIEEEKKEKKVPFRAPLIALSILANQGSKNTPNSDVSKRTPYLHFSSSTTAVIK